ncbi:DUF3102 domain-containing protein [Ancylobacter sp. Lp-2]|uniref:DUF3102 domain-containing protein n=1 Tax=Ancylobacter sp. Lp-2 TaxID=2881339 RepID=UPI001E2ECC6C|nr:DUF3102 domain-containing protein [Ancylobacter sp. Lp-2]MCB4771454.1 DUF3102 domain-containing protein [Ancylobacter sp. Lp-2]
MVPAVFDYNAVPADVAAALRGQAERIRKRLTKATADMIDTGRDLLAAKAQLKHGDFTSWVESAIGIRMRAAQELMRIAEIADGESAKFALLPPYAATRLAAPSVPAASRAAFVQRAEVGERVTVVEVDRELVRLREQREAAKKAEEEAKRTPRSKAAREAAARKREEESVARRLREEETERRGREGADELALILHARLTPAEWRRVRELLGDREVTRPVYSSGVQIFRTVKAIDSLGEPSSDFPAHAVAEKVIDRLGSDRALQLAEFLEADNPRAIAAAIRSEMEVQPRGDRGSSIPDPAPSIMPAPSDGDFDPATELGFLRPGAA